MNTKTIKISDFSDCIKRNEGKGISDIFNIAWKETDEYKNYIYNKKRTVKILGTTCCGIALTWFSMILSPCPIANAGVLELNTLAIESPELISKLETIKELYSEYLSMTGIEHNYHVFMDMVGIILDRFEFVKFIDATKGLSIEQVINFLASI